jgi:hypothetical protein
MTGPRTSDRANVRPTAGRTEQRKTVLSHRFDHDPLVAASVIEPDTKRLVSQQPGEHVGQRSIVLQIAIRHAVRHLDVAIAERCDGHELFRPIDRQRPEQKGVDDGEDAGAGADAESKGQ